MAENVRSTNIEVRAIARCSDLIDALDPPAQERVMAYLMDLYAPKRFLEMVRKTVTEALREDGYGDGK